MLPVLQQLGGSIFSDISQRWLVEAALGYFVTFLLVLTRLSGLMLIGPFFADSAVPTRVKGLLAMTLALMITPALPGVQGRGFDQLDVDQNGVLSVEESPRGVTEALATVDQAGTEEVTRARFTALQGVPSTIFDLIWLGATELVIGMLLGLGVVIVLAGLQMAGETFDQQAGTALSEIFNPTLGASSSPTGQLMFMLGTTALLVMLPFDGHLMMLMHLLRTFEVLPLGMAWVDGVSFRVLLDLMSQSFVIAIQIAAPLLAAMALLSVAMGFLGFTVPQINVLVLGFPIRAMLSLGILLLTFSGATDSILQVFPQTLEAITQSLIASGTENGSGI